MVWAVVTPDEHRGGRVLALTGTRTFLGHELLRRLDGDPRWSKILALDVRPPRHLGRGKIEYIPLDLTHPTVDDELATVLTSRGVDTVVHGAFLSHPTHATDWAHELEDVGTMHVFNACAGARPRRVVMISSTLVYGAEADHPNFLTEDAPLRAEHAARYVRDRVRAEQQAARFAAAHRDVQVCVLRFAPILGPTAKNLVTRHLGRLVAPVMMGHDPLVQLIHEQDAAWALALAVEKPATGAFNIVGKGVLPYTTVLALLGRLPLPVPYPLAKPLAQALWATRLSHTPASLLPFLRHVCVADGARARAVLGFSPRLSIKRTLLDFLGVSPEDFATDVARAQG